MSSDDRPSEPLPEPPRAAPYLDAYRKAVDDFGPSFQATLWSNERYQTVRFQVFTTMFDFTDATILDAGAGDGALARHLHEQGVRFGSFLGLEAMPEMVERAKSMAPPNALFETADFATDPGAFRIDGATPDVIVFSGSLNTFKEELALETLERAWEATGRALLFNFLTSRTDRSTAGRDTGPARRFDPLRLLDWALSRTTSVAFRQDYLPGHDATIGMHRRPD